MGRNQLSLNLRALDSSSYKGEKMMYGNKLAAAVKVNGRVLREQKDTVFCPFGVEYSLVIKNLNTVRALVRVSIDGQDATEGTSLIVEPNQSVELERFIRGGNLNEGNRFKFIERTKKIEDGPRGIGVEDGLIRIEYEFEKVQPPVTDVNHHHYHHYYHWDRKYYWDKNIWYTNTYGISSSTASERDQTRSGSPLRSKNLNLENSVVSSSNTVSAAAQNFAVPQNASETTSFVNDAGITVPGSVSNQKFNVGSWFPTDGQQHALVIKIVGAVGEQAVVTPVTVRAKPKCVTCGHTNKATAKFCSQCGTGLDLVGKYLTPAR